MRNEPYSGAGDDVVVRRVRADEVTAVRDLRLRALDDTPEAFESTSERERAFEPAVWAERTLRGATSSDSATFVAESGGVLVGMAGAHAETDRPGGSYLFGMWVDPRVRRAGIGLALTRAVEGWARSTGLTRMRLWVVASNQRAIALYRRAGYVETGESKSLRGQHDVIEVEMEKGL